MIYDLLVLFLLKGENINQLWIDERKKVGS